MKLVVPPADVVSDARAAVPPTLPTLMVPLVVVSVKP